MFNDYYLGHFLKKAGEKLNAKSDGGSSAPAPAPEAAAAAQVVPPQAAVETVKDDVVPRDSPSFAMSPFFASESEPFYLNIVVVDSAQAVQTKLDVKLGKGFWSNQASKLAKQVVSESKVAAKVAAQLSEKVSLIIFDLHVFAL